MECARIFLSKDKILCCAKNTAQKLLRKNVAKKFWKSYRRATWSRVSGPDHGATVTLKATEWLAPEVAVTVMLEVPGGVPIFGGVLLPPPQLTRQKPSMRAPNAMDHRGTFLLRLSLLRAPIHTTNSPNTIATGHAAKVQGCIPANGTAAEAGAVVVMVSVVDTGPPLSIRLAGEKLQLEAAGNPLQANVTEELKPLTGLPVMVNMAV
jgi:hypothetical protein